MAMEIGTCYLFPPFEGKYAENNEKEVEFTSRMPLHPDIDKILVIYETQLEAIKSDGWSWGPSNKSSKKSFMNIRELQRSLKFKCNVEGCPAVKYVETVFDYNVSRIYYENHHKHKSEECEDQNNDIFASCTEDEENVFKNMKKLKRRRSSKPNGKAKKLKVDESDEELNNAFQFNHMKTSTPASLKQSAVTKVNFSIENKQKPDSVPIAHEKHVNKNVKFKETLELVDLRIHDVLKENVDLKLKIKMNMTHLKTLKEENHLLSRELVAQNKDIQRLNIENQKITNLVNLGNEEVKNMTDNNEKIENLMLRKDFTLNDQISVLQNLINEKIREKGNNNEEIIILKKSLQICSEKKREALVNENLAYKDDRQSVSRNLLSSFEATDIEEILADSVDGSSIPIVGESLSKATGAPEVSILSNPSPSIHRLSSPTPTNDRLSSPTPSNDRLSSPTPSNDRLSSPTGTNDRLSSPTPSNDRLSCPTPTNIRLSGPTPTDDRLSNPAPNDNRLSSPAPTDDRSSEARSGKEGSNILKSVSRSGESLSSSGCVQVQSPLITSPGAKLMIPSLDSQQVNDTMIQDSSIEDVHDIDAGNYDLDSSITFLDNKQTRSDENLAKLNSIVDGMKSTEYEKVNNYAISFKVTDDYWADCQLVMGQVPHGHSGKAVFQIDLKEEMRTVKCSLIKEIEDGRNWSKKKIAIKAFEGCLDRKRWYQDCNGYLECKNDLCSARRLFSRPTQSIVKDKRHNTEDEKEYKCSSCDEKMKYFQCIDYTIKDKLGRSPQARRYLDFDWCHLNLSIKYVGTHTCCIGRKVLAMDVQFVKKYFKDNPSSTASRFKDWVIANAISEGKNIEEVSLQYADLSKIRQIMLKTKKVQDPDGTGIVFLRHFAESLGNKLNDKYLLTVTESPLMFIVSSKERIRVAALMSEPTFDTYESASIDFCESQFKEFSVMEVTTYSGELRQLVPMFQIVFKKPAENADNVSAALKEIDKIMEHHSGIKFDPLQWTTDNSGALENGIIDAKGEQAKPFLASDKLHDHNNIDRAVKTAPLGLQYKLKKEIFKMINGAVPSVSENIYECVLSKAKNLPNQKLHRSLVFNYRKRHKYWNCYREVIDNNATSEQVNRVMTRHGKGEGLIAGVQRMVRNAIADKSKFKLAEDNVMVNKGPDVKDRRVRVEKSLLKSLPEIVTSIQEECEIQSQKPKADDMLKEKALEDFKPKASDTHRSDKKRITKRKQVRKKVPGSKGFLKLRKIMKQKKVTQVQHEISQTEVTVTFKTSIGIENTVTLSDDGVLCTCVDHADNYFCPEIFKVFELLKMPEWVQKKSFSKHEFTEIKKKSKLLKVTSDDPLIKEWELDRCMKTVKCSTCKEFMHSGELLGIHLKMKFHPSRFCLPEDLVNVQAELLTDLEISEETSLGKSGIKV